MTTTPAGSPPPAELTRQIELLMAKNERLVTMLEAARAQLSDMKAQIDAINERLNITSTK